MHDLIEYLSAAVNSNIPNDTTTKMLSSITNKELGVYLEDILLLFASKNYGLLVQEL